MYPALLRIRTALAAALLATAPAIADGPSRSFITFEGDTPGIAEIRVGRDRIDAVKRLDDGGVTSPFKIAAAPAPEDGATIFVAIGGKAEPGIRVIRLPEGRNISIPLAAEVSDLALDGDRLLVAANKGRFYRIAPDGTIEAELNARKALDPPGRNGEHIRVVPGADRAIVSFQKDDDNSAARGNRLAILDSKSLTPLADIPLPRNHPDLHIADDPTAQGPGPEMIFLFPKSNTVAVTLDLYGAILFAKADAATAGRLEAPASVASSADGAFGVAFPDRALAFSRAGRDWLLVSNASKDGGFALFDVASRKMLRYFPAVSGAEPPILVGNRIVSVLSGKVKTRTAKGVQKASVPAKELHVFDLPADAPAPPDTFASGIEHRVLPLPISPANILPAPAGRVLVTGTDGPEAAAILVEPGDGRVLDRQPLPGPPVRATQAP